MTKLARYRKMLREARNLGFIDEFCLRTTKGRPSVVQMRCSRGERFLTIQFWGDGKHRVSHGANLPIGTRETTAPTDFTNLCGMYRAIAFEWQRKSTEPGT